MYHNLCAQQGSELSSCRRYAMTSRSVCGAEQKTGDDVRGGVCAKVLSKEGQSIDEHVQCGYLNQVGLQQCQYQKEERCGCEAVQLQAPQSDALCIHNGANVARQGNRLQKNNKQ